MKAVIVTKTSEKPAGYAFDYTVDGFGFKMGGTVIEGSSFLDVMTRFDAEQKKEGHGLGDNYTVQKMSIVPVYEFIADGTDGRVRFVARDEKQATTFYVARSKLIEAGKLTKDKTIGKGSRVLKAAR